MGVLFPIAARLRRYCDREANRGDWSVNIAIFSAKRYDREFLNAANGSLHKLRFFEPHLNEAGLGSISEVFDAEPPFRPRGCIAQAWSVAEVLRAYMKTNDGAEG